MHLAPEEHAPRPVGRRRWTWPLALVIITLVTAGLHWASGVGRCEAGVVGGEPGHFLTALALRDWMGGGLGQDWRAWLSDFAAHYPAAAGPEQVSAFHVVEAVWLRWAGPTVMAARGLSAVLGMVLAFLTFAALRPRLGFWPALVAGVVLCLLPMVQHHVSIISPDALFAVLCLFVIGSLSRHVRHPSWQAAGHAAAWAGLALLVRPETALVFVLLPPLVALACGRGEIMKRGSSWLPVAVAAVAGAGLAGWMTGIPDFRSLSFQPGAAARYATMQGAEQFGLCLVAASLMGVVRLLRRGRRGLDPFWAAVLVFPLVALACSALNPGTLAPRLLLPVAPCIVWLGARGLAWSGRRGGALMGMTAAVLSIAFVFRIPRKTFAGFDSVAAAVASAPAQVHVISDESGSGALQVALALRDPARPSWRVVPFTPPAAAAALPASGWLVVDDSLPLDLRPGGWNGLLDRLANSPSLQAFPITRGGGTGATISTSVRLWDLSRPPVR